MPWGRQSRHARGYGTAWDRLRIIVMQRDSGICQCPECKGGELRLLPAHEVDHIVRKADGGTDALSNLRAVNRDCHKRLTAMQNGAAPRPEIGADGWPTV